ncbi:MAG: DUF1992 domain-containing protein [Chloroflexi bacterium]|nr:DUF1992 domain-containing protein [Chloroflexota bacterium]
MAQDNRWESKIEESIRQAISDGRAGHLPGAGKPLKLEDDPNTPEEMRTAYKILRENDLQPDWIMAGRELDEKRDKILQTLRKAAEAYRGALGDAQRIPDAERASERRQNAESAWQKIRQILDESVMRYNKQVVTYNLKLPGGIPHRPYFDVQRELERRL